MSKVKVVKAKYIGIPAELADGTPLNPGDVIELPEQEAIERKDFEYPIERESKKGGNE